MQEITGPVEDGDYVRRFRVPWIEWRCDSVMPVNLDGEPVKYDEIRFESIPGAINLVLPASCPLLGD